jgi:hypothetical protein
LTAKVRAALAGAGAFSTGGAAPAAGTCTWMTLLQ